MLSCFRFLLFDLSPSMRRAIIPSSAETKMMSMGAIECDDSNHGQQWRFALHTKQKKVQENLIEKVGLAGPQVDSSSVWYIPNRQSTYQQVTQWAEALYIISEFEVSVIMTWSSFALMHPHVSRKTFIEVLAAMKCVVVDMVDYNRTLVLYGSSKVNFNSYN